ncbi:MAG: bifunctional isocitrate dehydrogenase kinase/phosphatase [Gammaproteobacteria bacterium]|nr:bifunctional isocitrate dehydrogenase kinase/phosphatase [Gammaproteobacteria bacterium]
MTLKPQNSAGEPNIPHDRRATPLSRAIARTILEGFNAHYQRFRYVSQQAKSCFESGDWHGIQTAVRRRIAFYDQHVLKAVERLRGEFNVAQLENTDWQQIKQQFVALLADHKQPECAETFFNSVSCKILHRDYFRNDFIFVRPGVSTEHMDSDPPSYRSYYPLTEGLRKCLLQIIADYGLACPFANVQRDIRRVILAARAYLPRPFWAEPDCQIQVLGSLFYRNKGAYVIGRVINGNRPHPFALPILRDANGQLYIDTLLFKPDQLAVLFSFSRAYFLVDMEVPSAYVSFVRTMVPNKPQAELYSMVGLQKQGKTLFYRDFLHHLRHSRDQFIIAPGIKGLVMVVFTLPSYPYVFKVIRDVMGRPKKTTRENVKAKYQLVKYHDRVGRMADMWEYSQVALPKARFSQEVIDELRTLTPSSFEDAGDSVIIRHVYIERRMTPLNIYLDYADAPALERAVIEYGNAIKQMASANIFPGDLLFKNFGVTRLGRVVFYDYDEVSYLTECNFRSIPPAPTPEYELSAEPWYPVDPNDIFPEEFATFLLGDPRLREVFKKYHADLLEPAFWEAKQDKLRHGIIEDVFPYAEAIRFQNSFGAHRRRVAEVSTAPVAATVEKQR